MERIVLVHRPTRLDSLVARFNTRQQAKFYIEHINGSFDDYEREHAVFSLAREQLLKIAQQFGKVQEMDWKFLPNFLFRESDIILTIGQDGLVANTLKYLSSQPVIGFNPDPERWDGVLSQFSVQQAVVIIPAVITNKATVRSITKAQVQLSDKQTLFAVNDFFVGVRNHTSARYLISHKGTQELQSSSGIVVSTPLGSSGWMRSILTGSTTITSRLSDSNPTLKATKKSDWAREELTFAVREPFPSVSTKASLVYGKVSRNTTLQVESMMGENGIVFSDGIEHDYLEFNHSVSATFTVAGGKGRIVVRK